MDEVDLPAEGAHDAWRGRLLDELRRVTFHSLPERIPPARPTGEDADGAVRIETEDGIVVPVRKLSGPGPEDGAERVLLVVAGAGDDDPVEGHLEDLRRDGDAVHRLQPRGVGPTRWTEKDPPNYVARAHVLLGRTVDSGRVRDVAATARTLRAWYGPEVPITVVGRGAAGLLGAYAALLEPEIAGVVAIDPPASHMDPGAPELLNVLRVLDVPEALGMLAPRPLSLRGERDEALEERVHDIYARAGAEDRFERR
jgi:hypothetical protein